MATTWDSGEVSFSSQGLGSVRDVSARESRAVARKEFSAFLRAYRAEESFVYR